MNVPLILLLVSLSAAYPTGPHEGNSEDDYVVNLAKELLEYGRWLLKRHSEIEFPPLPPLQINNDDVMVQFQMKDLFISNIDNFVADKIESNLEQLQNSFGVTIPEAHLRGNFDVSGKAFQRDVQGSGTFSAAIDTFTTTADIQYAINQGNLQIDVLNLDFDVADAKFDVNGLNIDGFSKEDIETYLNNHFSEYIRQERSEICQNLSMNLKFFVNQMTYGHSVTDIIAYFNNIVASTPDPPPIPL